jgi:single-stranded DNA-binding protein
MSIECAFFGALGRDAESKVSGSGKPYLRLNVRVGDGDTVQWVSVMAFDERAIEVADKLVKGARVYIEGRLSVSEWTGSDGAKRHGLSVMSWHCRLSQIGRNRPPKREKPAPAASGREVAARSHYAPNGQAPFDDDIPF